MNTKMNQGCSADFRIWSPFRVCDSCGYHTEKILVERFFRRYRQFLDDVPAVFLQRVCVRSVH